MKHHKRIIRAKERSLGSRLLRLVAENHVFESEGYYYKFPNYPKLVYGSSHPYRTIEQYYGIVQEYFGGEFRVARTSIHHYKENYFLRQERIAGEKVIVTDLGENPELHRQVSRLMDINDRLWEERGLYLDVIGSDGLVNPSKLHNLLFDGEHITLFDFGLLNGRSPSKFYAGLSTVVHDLQRFYIRKILSNFSSSPTNR